MCPSFIIPASGAGVNLYGEQASGIGDTSTEPTPMTDRAGLPVPWRCVFGMSVGEGWTRPQAERHRRRLRDGAKMPRVVRFDPLRVECRGSGSSLQDLQIRIPVNYRSLVFTV